MNYSVLVVLWLISLYPQYDLLTRESTNTTSKKLKVLFLFNLPIILYINLQLRNFGDIIF